MPDTRAAIVGAGIAGLATALALRRAGIDAHVYERAPELRPLGAPGGGRVARCGGAPQALATRRMEAAIGRG